MLLTIWETQDKTFRIVESYDDSTTIEEAKGDCFKPECNPDIDLKLLKADERRFERRCIDEGFYGYELQVWDPTPGAGYINVDSCYGFVGQYVEGAEDYEHYIVQEMKDKAEKMRNE